MTSGPQSASLGKKLNAFFAHFELQLPEIDILHLPVHSSCILTLKEQHVGHVLRTENLRKAHRS